MNRELKKRNKPSWAQTAGIQTGKLNDVVDGITIHENNRATVYEKRKSAIQELLSYQASNYTAKGVKSVIYGVRLPVLGTSKKLTKTIYYAVFCQDGFITDVT